MRAGQHLGIVAIGIERIFHHIMPGGADHMHEKLPRKFRQFKPRAYFGAVDYHAGIGRRQSLFPFSDLVAFFIHQPAPDVRILGAIHAPVIGRHHARMVPSAIAEERKVGGEV